MKLPFFRADITEEEIGAVAECLRSGWLTTGPITRAFEEEFASYVGAKHAIALNSCTAALHLALEAIGLQRGELVLVPTMTFAATAEVVRYFDAIPVFVDCDPDTLCVDPRAVRKTLEHIRGGHSIPGVSVEARRVRALIPMHYGWQMCEVDELRSLTAAYEIDVIEDAAHTLPAYYRSAADAPWRSVGTTGKLSSFSFY